MSRETKTVHLLVKATGIRTDDDGQEFGQIEAYGAMFGNVDEGNDRIVKGAFTRTIQNSKSRAKSRSKQYIIPMLWQHDTHELIGGWSSMSEDDQGLLCKGEIALGTQRGKEYYILAKAGMSDQFSITYDVPTGGAKYDKSGVRDLTEMRLYSVDPVTFAMNDETYLVGIKSRKIMNTATKKKDVPPQKKTLMEHYQEETCQDLLEDWQDVYVCSLTSAILDAFTIGDSPESDISDALDAFKELVMSKFITQAMECDLSGYLEENTYTSTPASYTLANGSSSSSYGGYYGMASNRMRSRKTGRAISAANQQTIDDHVANMKSIAAAHMKAVQTAADDFATVMQGSEAAYGTDPGDAGDQQEGKNARASHQPGVRTSQNRPSQKSDTDEEEAQLTLALANIRQLRN